ncbi:MAG: hypothetical protein H7Y13_01895 [Sphingobacteriaceae bacterium]|nr:hypothetical protein [Sphingobacteriaceae bacterium]
MATLVIKETIQDFEELGIIDYQDDLESAFANSTESMIRISESVEWVGTKLNEKTAELERMKAKKPELGTKELRNFCQRSAMVMNDFASRLEPEIPLFIRNFEIGANAISQLINLSSEDKLTEDVVLAYTSTVSLSGQISGTINSMEGFQNEVSSLPRMEKELNRARHNVEIKLSNLIEQMNISYSIIGELIKQFKDKYDFK